MLDFTQSLQLRNNDKWNVSSWVFFQKQLQLWHFIYFRKYFESGRVSRRSPAFCKTANFACGEASGGGGRILNYWIKFRKINRKFLVSLNSTTWIYLPVHRNPAPTHFQLSICCSKLCIYGIAPEDNITAIYENWTI